MDGKDDDLFTKIKEFLGDQVKTINENTNKKTDEIKNNLVEIKKDITANTNAITEVNNRVDNINNDLNTMQERIQSLENRNNNDKYDTAINEAVNDIDNRIRDLRSKADNSKIDILREAKKIVGISPVNDNDLDYILSNGANVENVLNIAAQDFLTYELKFSKNEIEDLDITNITRPRSENSDTIYIHCKTEKAVQYIHRKKA